MGTLLPSRFQIDEPVSVNGMPGVVIGVSFSAGKVAYSINVKGKILSPVFSENVQPPRYALRIASEQDTVSDHDAPRRASDHMVPRLQDGPYVQPVPDQVHVSHLDVESGSGESDVQPLDGGTPWNAPRHSERRVSLVREERPVGVLERFVAQSERSDGTDPGTAGRREGHGKLGLTIDDFHWVTVTRALCVDERMPRVSMRHPDRTEKTCNELFGDLECDFCGRYLVSEHNYVELGMQCSGCKSVVYRIEVWRQK